jgi:hypothetical protein
MLKKPASAEPLRDEEKLVLEYLGKAGAALTVRQLESGTTGFATSLEDILAGLVERKLVSRLNTLIPTYTCRNSGAKAHAE